MKLSNNQIAKITMFNKRDNFINVPANNTLLYSNVIVGAKIDAANGIRKLLDQAIGQKKQIHQETAPRKNSH